MLQSISKITALLITVFISGYIATGVVYSAVMADFKVEPDTVLYPGDLEVKPVPEDTFQTDQYTPIQPSVTPIGKELKR